MSALLWMWLAVAGKCGTARATSNGVVLPAAIRRVEPKAAACRGTYRGFPVLETTIDKTGIPRDVRIVRHVAPCVDRAAVDALRQWRFCPAERDGKPIEMKMTYTVFIDYR